MAKPNLVSNESMEATQSKSDMKNQICSLISDKLKAISFTVTKPRSKPRSKSMEAKLNMAMTGSEKATQSESTFSQIPDKHKAISSAATTRSESTDYVRDIKLSPATKKRILDMLTPKEFPPKFLRKRKRKFAKLRNPMTLRSGKRVAACQVCLGNDTTRGKKKWCRSCLKITFYAGRKVLDDPFYRKPLVLVSTVDIRGSRQQAKEEKRAAQEAIKDIEWTKKLCQDGAGMIENIENLKTHHQGLGSRQELIVV